MEFWEQEYSQGRQLNKYPYDSVVSLVFQKFSHIKDKSKVNILEIGCGAGNNLWFCAREGFNVTGIDISQSAISYANKRFQNEQLDGDLIVGDFSKIAELGNEQFDLVIDRTALTYVSLKEAQNHISTIYSKLKSGGIFFFNVFADKHSMCASGEYTDEGVTINMTYGVSNTKTVTCYGRRDVFNALGCFFEIESIKLVETSEMISPDYFVEAEWRVVARKK